MFARQNSSEDYDRDLRNIQDEMYYCELKDIGLTVQQSGMPSCFYIFHCARNSVTLSSMLNAHEWYDLFEKKGFDHRVLWHTHYKIAYFYQWIERDRKRRPVLSGQEMSFPDWHIRQLHNKNKQSRRDWTRLSLSRYHRFILDSWTNYFVHEIDDITHGEPSISEHIIKSVLFQNTEKGYASEDAIDDFLTSRYGTEFKKIFEAETRRNRETNNALQGYVYILVSPALRQDVVKIGSTTRLPNRRAEELSIGTGVPVRFFVAFELLVADCKSIEQIVHERLASNRLSHNREFFDVPLKDAIDVINEVARSFERCVD